jgi:protein TonB
VAGGTTTTGNTTGTPTTATLPATPKAAAPVKYVDEMPVLENLNGYLNKNIHYPDAARENGIQGRVIVQFVVNEDGGISEAQVVRGIGGGCDEEALRVVRNMPKWKPGRQHGSAVKVLFLLPVSFILE